MTRMTTKWVTAAALSFMTVAEALLSQSHDALSFVHPKRMQAHSNIAPPRSTVFRQKTGLFLAPQQLGVYEKLVLPTKDGDGVDDKDRAVALHDWTREGPLDFDEVWSFQRELLDNHLASKKKERQAKKTRTDPVDTSNRTSDEQGSDRGVRKHADTVLMLQHEPVFTLGTASDPKFILQRPSQDGAVSDPDNAMSDSNEQRQEANGTVLADTPPPIPVVRIDRGGEVTYHGPGQLVVYPVIDLRRYQQDLHWYMRALEECIIIALGKCGIDNAVRMEGLTGIWIDGKKVAALGVKCRQWITQHGLAVNVEPSSLAPFRGIVPCGLEGKEVTCVQEHLLTTTETARPNMTVGDFAVFMKEAMEEVFCIQLELSEAA